MLKETTNTNGYWQITDNTRDTFNPEKDYIYADDNTVNTPSTVLDFLSNGFKLRLNDSYWNSSDKYYLYLAFAESPFKTARAR